MSFLHCHAAWHKQMTDQGSKLDPQLLIVTNCLSQEETFKSMDDPFACQNPGFSACFRDKCFLINSNLIILLANKKLESHQVQNFQWRKQCQNAILCCFLAKLSFIKQHCNSGCSSGGMTFPDWPPGTPFCHVGNHYASTSVWFTLSSICMQSLLSSHSHNCFTFTLCLVCSEWESKLHM